MACKRFRFQTQEKKAYQSLNWDHRLGSIWVTLLNICLLFYAKSLYNKLSALRLTLYLPSYRVRFYLFFTSKNKTFLFIYNNYVCIYKNAYLLCYFLQPYFHRAYHIFLSHSQSQPLIYRLFFWSRNYFRTCYGSWNYLERIFESRHGLSVGSKEPNSVLLLSNHRFSCTLSFSCTIPANVIEQRISIHFSLFTSTVIIATIRAVSFHWLQMLLEWFSCISS